MLSDNQPGKYFSLFSVQIVNFLSAQLLFKLLIAFFFWYWDLNFVLARQALTPLSYSPSYDCFFGA